MYYLQVQTVILLYGISLIQGFFHFTHKDFLLQNKQYLHLNVKFNLQDVPEKWFEQPVDHFNVSDLRTWKQKYSQMNASKPERPILLYLGGAGPEGGGVLPFVLQIYTALDASCFTLEHRYYGSSQPLTPPTTENLAFLTSRQALADAANFLIALKESPEFKNSKVIVVGGSYAGNLAAWMKVLYPELVDAVLASSAPVLAKKDYNEYFETVTDTFRKYGSQDCVDQITGKFNTFHELLKSSEGIEKLKKEKRICENVDMTVPENQQMFFVDEMNLYALLSENSIIDDIMIYCKNVSVFKVNHKFSTYWNNDKDCTDYDFNHWITDVSRVMWFYQKCTEFGYFQTCASNKQMFGNTIPISLYYKTCRILFGDEFNEERVDQGVRNTNRLYGGLTPNVTNVVFVNGDMDPWHRLGILQDLSADAPAIYLEGSSHCHDLMPDSSDSDKINDARKRIIKLLKSWIEG